MFTFTNVLQLWSFLFVTDKKVRTLIKVFHRVFFWFSASLRLFWIILGGKMKRMFWSRKPCNTWKHLTNKKIPPITRHNASMTATLHIPPTSINGDKYSNYVIRSTRGTSNEWWPYSFVWITSFRVRSNISPTRSIGRFGWDLSLADRRCAAT